MRSFLVYDRDSVCFLWGENVGAASETASQPRAGVVNCFYPSMHAIRVSCARLLACGECHGVLSRSGCKAVLGLALGRCVRRVPAAVAQENRFCFAPANPDSTWNRSLVAHMIYWPGHLRAGERVPRRRPEMHIPAVATRGAEARPKICLELRSAGHKIFSRRGAGNFLFRTTVAGTEKAHSWSLTRPARSAWSTRIGNRIRT